MRACSVIEANPGRCSGVKIITGDNLFESIFIDAFFLRLIYAFKAC